MSTVLPGTALVPYFGAGDAGALAWLRLSRSARRRTAMQAAYEHDARTLWSLTEAWLRSCGPAGATVSTNTVRHYRTGVRLFLEAWARVDLLHPDPDAATTYLRALERRGLAPGTIQGRLAAARALCGVALVACGGAGPIHGVPAAAGCDAGLGEAYAVCRR